MTNQVSDLDHVSGSWIAVCKETGANVFETFNRATAERINQERYDVLPASEALGRMNQRAKAVDAVEALLLWIAECDHGSEYKANMHKPVVVEKAKQALREAGRLEGVAARIEAMAANS